MDEKKPSTGGHIPPQNQPSLWLCMNCCLLFAEKGEKNPTFGYLIHHRNYLDFRESKEKGCQMCNMLWGAFHEQFGNPNSQFSEAHSKFSTGYLTLSLDFAVLRGREGELKEMIKMMIFTDYHNFERGTPYKEPGLEIGVKIYNPQSGPEDLAFSKMFLFQPVEETLALTPRTPHFSETSNGDACLGLMRRWLIQCTQSHSKCPKTSSVRIHLPTRVLEVGSRGHQTIKLVLPVQDLSTENGTYATLSHCWGSTKHPKLISSTFERLRAGIPLADLPRTFQDAVFVCQQLGILYLWIDSLCIFQDSPDDWREESAKMDRIYQDCFLNIAATSSVDGDGGLFFHRDPLLIRPLTVRRSPRPGAGTSPGLYYCFPEDSFTRSVADAPLNSRGWVMQERMFAPRIIHFSRQQLFWECATKVACETFQDDAPFPKKAQIKDSLVPITQELRLFKTQVGPRLFRRLLSERNVERAWWDFVRAYSDCKLTNDEDILIAASGIAKQVREATGGTYLAGLWQENLCLGLLWYTQREDPVRVKSWRAPSWSWASVKGPVHIPSYYDHAKWARDLGLELDVVIASSLKEVSITPMGKDDTGQLSAAIVTIRARMLSATVNMEAKPEGRHNTSDRSSFYTLKGYGDRARDMALSMDSWIMKGFIRFDDNTVMAQLAPNKTMSAPCMPLALMAYSRRSSIRAHEPGYGWLRHSESAYIEGLVMASSKTISGVYERIGHFSVALPQEAESRVKVCQALFNNLWDISLV